MLSCRWLAINRLLKNASTEMSVLPDTAGFLRKWTRHFCLVEIRLFSTGGSEAGSNDQTEYNGFILFV